MKPSELLKRERRLAVERSLKHWGTASVRIDILEFPNEEDSENVERLAKLLQKDLRGLNPTNRIPAKINSEDLHNALGISKLTIEELNTHPNPENGFPELCFPEGFRLECRRGLHRAKAAQRILPPGEQCWTIDLFHSGRLNPGLSENRY